MSTIILPAGSNRNKVEYLAKQMQAHGLTIAQINIAIYGDGTDENKGILAELENGGGGALVADVFNGVADRNLLMNPDFSAPSRGMTYNPNGGATCERWLFADKTLTAGVDEFNLVRAPRSPCFTGWGIELERERPDGGYTSAGFTKHSSDYWQNVHTNPKFAKTQFPISPWVNMKSGKVLHFSVFEAPLNVQRNPLENNLPYFNFETMEEENYNKFSAYLCCGLERGVRFGVVKLDRNGDFVEFIAEQNIAGNGTNITKEFWIHGITLEAGGLYAFVIESSGAGKSCKPYAAGVFLNNEQLDINPPLRNAAALSGVAHGSLGLYDLAQQQTLNVPNYPAPYGKSKHYLFCVVNHADQDYAPKFFSRVEHSFSYDEQSGSFTGSAVAEQGQEYIHYYYSPTPTHINFFNNGG